MAIAAIREKNTETKVDSSRITSSRYSSSPRAQPSRETTLALLPKQPFSCTRTLVETRTTSSLFTLALPTTRPKSYATILCIELQIGKVDIGKSFIPTRYNIMHNSRFGKPSLDHSFTSDVYFEHILLHILNKVFYHSHPQWHCFHVIRCSPIFTPCCNILSDSISTTRVQQFLAVSLFYDLDLFPVIRFLRRTYTGGFCNTFSPINTLYDTEYDLVLITEVSRTLLIVFSIKMNATSTRDKFMKFFR